MKYLIVAFVLLSSSAFARFKHESDQKFNLFFKDYIANPAKQNVPNGAKFGPFKTEVIEEIKASPEMSRYLATGMAQVFIRNNFKNYKPKFEKKFGKLDEAKMKLIGSLVTESVYAEKPDVIKKMTIDGAYQKSVYENKLNKVLALKELK